MLARARFTKLFPHDPLESAKIAGLRYVALSEPGITRRRRGRGWIYYTQTGKRITDPKEIARIQSLVIPPAWTAVWICPTPTGHIQATGRDAFGRLQYRYHPLYRSVRDATKFSRMLEFGRVLPKIRAAVRADLNLPKMPKEKILASVIRLLDTTHIRIGNEEYRKAHQSFGLTTLRNRHVEVKAGTIHFVFRGKSHQLQDVELRDRKLARIIRSCQCIPGHDLFQYIDDSGVKYRVTSEDVNEYLRNIAGETFTAKDFRTWAGTTLALSALERSLAASTDTEAKRNIVAAVKEVAARLGNRPATCRKYYIHPAIIEAYSQGELTLAQQVPHRCRGLRREESRILAVIKGFDFRRVTHRQAP